jgi:hypothetical protein
LQCDQQDLGAVDGEGGDQDRAATAGGPVDQLGELSDLLGRLRMQRIAVGGLDQHRVGRRRRVGSGEERVTAAPQIAAHEQGRRLDVVDGEMHTGRTEDVPGSGEAGRDPGCDVDRTVEVGRDEQRNGGGSVLRRVQRQGGLVLGEASLVGEAGLFLLEMGRIGQEDLAEPAGVGGRDDPAGEAVAHQSGQPAAVVDVGVGDDDGVDRGGIDRERLPVGQAIALRALEQSRVDEHGRLTGPNQEAAPRDRASSAEELEGGHADDSRILVEPGASPDAARETMMSTTSSHDEPGREVIEGRHVPSEGHRDDIERLLRNEWCRSLQADPSLRWRAEIVYGSPADVLLNMGRDLDASFVVVGSRGVGDEQALGSTSHHVVHHCDRPVVVVPPLAR